MLYYVGGSYWKERESELNEKLKPLLNAIV